MAYGAPAKLSRNAPCHCGSGRKYKKCCLRKDSRQYDLPPEPSDSPLSDRRQRLEASFELVFGPQKSRSSTRTAGTGEPSTRTHWRQLILKLNHPDGSHCDITLLRPLTWILQAGAEEGGTIFLDLPEMGARGQARVLTIRRCPPIEPGQGGVITGTFHHSAGLAGDLVLEGEPEPLGVTPSHPFWSVDRQEWIPAGRLLPGERLKTLKGTTTVVSFKLRKKPEPVCNIEVEGDHVYRVGNSGVLVHNTSAADCNCEIEFTLAGTNPNDLASIEVSGEPTTGNGVYVKKHNDKTKVGSADNFRTRYTLSNPEGGCNIWYELSRTKSGPPSGVSLTNEETQYWTAHHQNEFDEAYVWRTIPSANIWGIRPVSPNRWRNRRHIFGYAGLPDDYMD